MDNASLERLGAWFEAQFATCEPRLRRIARMKLKRKEDVEDVLQEAFGRAWRGIKRLRNPECFFSWVAGILKHVIVDFIGRSCRNKYLEKELAAASAIPASRRKQATNQDSWSELVDAMLSLPENYRVPALMFYVEDKSIAQIANALQITGNTVKWRLYEARRRLRSDLRVKDAAERRGILFHER